MKKILILAGLLAEINAMAQSPQNISSQGNNLDSTEFIGTNNNQKLSIKVNGSTHTSFNTNGKLQVNSLAVDTASHVVAVNKTGELYALPFGQPGQILTADHVWIDPPVSYWQTPTKGDTLYTYATKVGINTNDPQYTLDVNGSGRFTGSLHVQEDFETEGFINASNGLILGSGYSRIQYVPLGHLGSAGKFIFGNHIADPLSEACMDANNSPSVENYGAIVSRVDATANASITMRCMEGTGNGHIEVEGTDGNSEAKNSLQLNYYCGRNTYINTNNGLDNRGGRVYIGERATMARYAAIGSNWPNDNLSSTVGLNIFSNETDETGIRINSVEWKNKALDIVDGTDSTISYATIRQDGKTRIGLVNPATVGNGSKLEVFGGYSSFLVYGNEYGDIQSTTAIRPHFADSMDFTIYQGAPGSGKLQMTVHDGRVGIGTFTPNALLEIKNDTLTHNFIRLQNTVNRTSNAIDLLAPDGQSNFRVKTNGELYARKLKITIGLFADYVFEKDYFRPTLQEVEKYIEAEKHLPNVPSAKEIAENGADMGDLMTKSFEKTEELFLYVIELDKRLKALEEENKELKKQNDQLLKTK